MNHARTGTVLERYGSGNRVWSRRERWNWNDLTYNGSIEYNVDKLNHDMSNKEPRGREFSEPAPGFLII